MKKNGLWQKCHIFSNPICQCFLCTTVLHVTWSSALILRLIEYFSFLFFCLANKKGQCWHQWWFYSVKRRSSGLKCFLINTKKTPHPHLFFLNPLLPPFLSLNLQDIISPSLSISVYRLWTGCSSEQQAHTDQSTSNGGLVCWIIQSQFPIEMCKRSLAGFKNRECCWSWQQKLRL